MRVWLNNVPLSGVTEIDPQLRWVAIGACKLRGDVRVDTNPVVKVGDEIAIARCGDLIRMDVAAPVQEMTVDAAKELIAALQGLCVQASHSKGHDLRGATVGNSDCSSPVTCR